MLQLDNKQPNAIVVPCPRCKTQQPGQIRGSYGVEDDDGPPSGTVYYLVECPGCCGPFLASRSEAWAGDGLFSIGEPQIVYPDSGATFDESVPPAIANSYLGALKTLQAGVPPATAIMCRQTLEAVCKHFGAKGRLVDMVDSLKDKGKLDPRLHEWAHTVLRTLGNDAAHDTAHVGHDDASDALEFTKGLIQHLFVLEEAFERFKKRRESIKSNALP